MQNAKRSTAPCSVAVLLFPGFSNLCLANAIEPLRAANALDRRERYRWRFVGIEGGVIASSSGLPVQLAAKLADDPGADMLLIMPSYDHERLATPICLRALQAARRRFHLLVGMDTGSWLAAAAGLLDDRVATIHWDVMDAFAERFPAVGVVGDRFVVDGDYASCGGAMTTLELMLHLIERQQSPMLSLEVAALFMHGERDPSLDPMQRLREDQMVGAAAALMRRHLERPLSIGDAAARLGVSQRALEAHFRDAIGVTPRAVYQRIRLAEARRLVEQTRLSIAEIADRCGYADAAAMTRAFKAAYGAPPRRVRQTSQRSGLAAPSPAAETPFW